LDQVDARTWLHDLFTGILGPDTSPALAAALVQLTDGAITTAHLDRDANAALTARNTAALLLAAGTASRTSA
jgi:predicted regulator of Ras-like GTPase activity (Roadblock/LC7/MglB family)